MSESLVFFFSVVSLNVLSLPCKMSVRWMSIVIHKLYNTLYVMDLVQ